MYGRVLEANGETDEPTVLLPWRDKLIFKFFHSADGLTLLDIQTSEALYLVLAILSSIGENEGTKVTSFLAKCVLHEFSIPSNRWFHSGVPCMQDCTSNWEIRAGR
ncbi:hypothetical protein D6C84_04077 [Aureobasidium pullulans]|uniref:Uncharacterized protein n=1 Tax=Aureobasidium pullulans TaxID=5580 RepID=A0A4V4L1A1_AURPU|nr:hypothetical protein D6C84_04077 [Aureobasidium pullulans]